MALSLEWSEQKMDGGLLRTILMKHKLLPAALDNVACCLMAAQSVDVGAIVEDGQPVVIILETNPEEGIRGVQFITEKPYVNQRKAELFDIAKDLRKRWFDDAGCYRVETRIPSDRTQTIRIMKHLGFRMETTPKGIRHATKLNGKPTDLVVMGLLPSDPAKELFSTDLPNGDKSDRITKKEVENG